MDDQSELSNAAFPALLLSSASRREIFTAAGAALIVSALPHQAVAYPPASDLKDSPPPRDEGFFFVIPGKNNSGGNDPDADRLFFISSAWLPLFELTDFLAQPTNVIITMQSPAALVTWIGHNLTPNEKIKFSNTGNLPPEIIVGDTYKVLHKVNDYTFALADKTGQPVNTSINGTGLASKIDRKKGIVGNLNQLKDQKWTVLYSDDVAASMPVGAAPGNFTALPDPPNSGDTYLAMSIV